MPWLSIALERVSSSGITVIEPCIMTLGACNARQTDAALPTAEMSSRQTLEAGATRQPAESARTFNSGDCTTIASIGTSTGNLRNSPRPEILALGAVGAVGSLRDPIEAAMDYQGRQVEGLQQTGLRKRRTPAPAPANDRSSSTRPQKDKDLKELEQSIISSPWYAANSPEPTCESPNSPYHADLYGIRGLSCYTAFVDTNPNGTFGCWYEECSRYSARRLEDALRHQRANHFNHKPFLCVPTNGAAW